MVNLVQLDHNNQMITLNAITLTKIKTLNTLSRANCNYLSIFGTEIFFRSDDCDVSSVEIFETNFLKDGSGPESRKKHW
jgi:hypothetical protein